MSWPARASQGAVGDARKRRGGHLTIDAVIGAHRREAHDVAMQGVECSCGAADPYAQKWSDDDYTAHLARAIRNHVAAGGAL